MPNTNITIIPLVDTDPDALLKQSWDLLSQTGESYVSGFVGSIFTAFMIRLDSVTSTYQRLGLGLSLMMHSSRIRKVVKKRINILTTVLTQCWQCTTHRVSVLHTF